MKIFDLIGRQEALFEYDLSQNERDLSEIVNMRFPEGIHVSVKR